MALQTGIKKKQCELDCKKISRIFWRKLLFSPAPLVVCLECNILLKGAFSWKELRYKQSLIYISRSWGTKTKQNTNKVGVVKPFYIISFFFPHGWGYPSQSNQPWMKELLASCIPQNTGKTTPKCYRHLIQHDVSTHSLWCLVTSGSLQFSSRISSSGHREAQVPHDVGDLECKLPWGKAS